MVSSSSRSGSTSPARAFPRTRFSRGFERGIELSGRVHQWGDGSSRGRLCLVARESAVGSGALRRGAHIRARAPHGLAAKDPGLGRCRWQARAQGASLPNSVRALLHHRGRPRHRACTMAWRTRERTAASVGWGECRGAVDRLLRLGRRGNRARTKRRQKGCCHVFNAIFGPI